MDTISIISLSVAFLSFVFNTVWNSFNFKKNRDKELQELINSIKTETKEKSEMQILFREMNKNLEKIVEDNKIMNDRIYALTERITALEFYQEENTRVNREFPLLQDKVIQAHQRIDLIEHDTKEK